MIIQEIATSYPGKQYSNQDLIAAHKEKEAELDEVLYKLTGGKTFTGNILMSEPFFRNLGVESRNILADPFNTSDWWKRHMGTDPFSVEGAIAYDKLMAGKEPLSENDRLIVLANVSDSPAPNIGYTVLSQLELRNKNFVAPSILAIQGEGCSGFISGLLEADIYLKAMPDSRVVVLSVELMATPLHHPKVHEALINRIKSAPREELSLLTQELIGLGIQRYLFGDGCAAALCVANHKGEGIQFTKFNKWVNLQPEDTHLLELRGIGTKALPHGSPFGYFFQQPNLLIERLTQSYLPLAMDAMVQSDLSKLSFAIHTGSSKILELVKNSLNLSEQQVSHSRHILKHQGNMNATTGAAILSRLLEQKEYNDIVAIFFGLGFALQMAQS